MEATTHLRFALLALCGVLLVGTAGYALLEGWSLVDSLYMTIITLTTVGYGEVHPLSPSSRLFTMGLIVAGVGIVGYTIGTLTQSMVEGQLRSLLGRRKLEREIATLKDHFIVCGFGRMGSFVCRELHAQGLPFVVVERNAELIQEIEEEHFLYVRGDATDDDVLLQAGIERAKGLVSSVASDADNVFITMSARGMNPSLYIVARAENEATERKLQRAGANRVVSPYRIGGMRMAQAILKPAVVDFIEIASQTRGVELLMEELEVGPHSQLVGTILRESGIRQKLGLIIIAIQKSSGAMIFNPASDTLIEAGDRLITMGDTQSLRQLERLCQGTP
ncbi:MAG: potassium channel protein [Nitrospinota bacterium]|nr:MAG: potassium channel protein [Nitrospinota bacterium]